MQLRNRTQGSPGPSLTPADRRHRIALVTVGALVVAGAAAPYVHAATHPTRTVTTQAVTKVAPLPLPAAVSAPTSTPSVDDEQLSDAQIEAQLEAIVASQRSSATSTGSTSERPDVFAGIPNDLAPMPRIPDPAYPAPATTGTHAGTNTGTRVDSQPTPGRTTTPTTPAPTTTAPLPGSGGQAASHAGSYVQAGYDDRLARWGTCTIAYKVYRGTGPADAINLVAASLAKVSAVTGITFTYAGPATSMPAAGTTNPDSAPVVIGWTAPGTSILPASGSHAVGFASTRWRPATDSTGQAYAQLYSGIVAISNQLPDSRLASGARTQQMVLLHEFGHLVGLKHVSDITQLMYPNIQQGHTGYGSGDLAGLAKVRPVC